MIYYQNQDVLQRFLMENMYFPIKKGQGFIYALRDGLQGDVRYIGKTIDYRKRLKHHCTNKYCSEKFYQWRKNLKDFIVLEIINVVLVAGLPEAEQEAINFYKSQNADLLNISTAKKENK